MTPDIPSIPVWVWAAFTVFVLSMLALDLGVFNKKSHTVSVKQALSWTAVWITLALIFCGGVWRFMGAQSAVEFLTGYVVEYSLSVDNIFVFLLVFSYFKVTAEHQHKVLFWGILGALVMRAVMIGLGAALLARFDWIIYIFGAFLLFTGLKLAFGKDHEVDPGHNPAVRALRKIMPIAPAYDGDKFFTVMNGKRAATPLLVVLVVIETTDLIFAVDSIPAIFGVTKNPFIVYTSNIFAILGLRSLYFALAGVMELFHYLKYALAFILSFVGLKMLLHSLIHMPAWVSLAVIISALAIAVVMSLLRPVKTPEEAEADKLPVR
jgi:tellurite resistance protein TerC